MFIPLFSALINSWFSAIIWLCGIVMVSWLAMRRQGWNLHCWSSSS